MSVSTDVNERLQALTAAGTSVWLDQLRRGLVAEGELSRLIAVDCLRGVTANPSIFEKAILGSDDYDSELERLARDGLDPLAIYERLAVADVQAAADVLRPVYDELEQRDGYVSLEVTPDVAADTEGTLKQVRDYWRRVDRPNLMIKIPGTPEGMPAIEQAIYEGININVTLLFAVEAYEKAAEAYIRGLERRHAEGLPLGIHSVASFFVSRVDTESDRRLAELGRTDVQGRAAIANARAAYVRFKEIFEGERFASLRAAGAPLQRPLWASTGVKNPAYRATLYVDSLVAPYTVNTMPPSTLLATEQADIRPGTGDVGAEQAGRELQQLADAGLDIADVTAKLLVDGVRQFEVAMEKLLDGIARRRDAVVTGRPPTIEGSFPSDLGEAIARRVAEAEEQSVARRVWQRDEMLWGGPGPEIGNRLGWLTVAEQMLETADQLVAFRERCRAEGLRDAVLLGMGGSSLAPEVFRQSFGSRPEGLRLHVIDSTDTGWIRSVEEAIELERTLFIVSTKSGGTIETLSLFKHFHAQLAERVGDTRAGDHFIAVTDPGSPLVELAERHGFRHTFLANPEIGGRYSALSHFGIVPAALLGADIAALLERGEVAVQACTNYDNSESNAGLWLGLALGESALHGRDKLTFVVDEPVASFGLWVEQLIAESTGKEGKGIVPVAGEPLGRPDAYGEDRVFLHLRNKSDPDSAHGEQVAALAAAGHPTLTVDFEHAEDLGRIMFFAEFATAVAGWVLRINPFDQPNVQEAKDNTNKVLDAYKRDGRLPQVEEAGDDALAQLLARVEPGRYLALMAFTQASDAFDREIERLRVAVRDSTRATTTFGYGPRYLHSTGQLHKGGPPKGVFLQLIHDAAEDAEIPGEPYGFKTLKNAQATGDLNTLREHGLPAERVRLEGDPVDALAKLRERIERLR